MHAWVFAGPSSVTFEKREKEEAGITKVGALVVVYVNTYVDESSITGVNTRAA